VALSYALPMGEAVQRMDLTDKQWEVLEPLIPEPPRREDGRGRPWRDPRDVLDGILWILRTGAPWNDLPKRYPPYQTCHRRFQQWIEEGVLGKMLEALAEDLEERGQIDLSECYIDGTFVVAKKGGVCWKDPRRGKGTKLVAFSEGSCVPLALHTHRERVLARTNSPLLKRLWQAPFSGSASQSV
jgi:transposase